MNQCNNSLTLISISWAYNDRDSYDKAIETIKDLLTYLRVDDCHYALLNEMYNTDDRIQLKMHADKEQNRRYNELHNQFDDRIKNYDDEQVTLTSVMKHNGWNATIRSGSNKLSSYEMDVPVLHCLDEIKVMSDGLMELLGPTINALDLNIDDLAFNYVKKQLTDAYGRTANMLVSIEMSALLTVDQQVALELLDGHPSVTGITL